MGLSLERWNVGALERWNVGTLERWNVGTLERWNVGALECWDWESEWLPTKNHNLPAISSYMGIYMLSKLANWLIGELAN
jgi:hypothetical protein